MKTKPFARSAFLATALVVAPALALPASSAMTPESQEAGKLLRSVGMEARAVLRHARQLEKLSRGSFTNWQDYDRQWNEIKPTVEQMSMHLAHLEAIRSSTLPWQQGAITRSAALIRKVEANTHKVRTYINAHPSGLSSDALKLYERSLSRDARGLARAVRNPHAAHVSSS